MRDGGKGGGRRRRSPEEGNNPTGVDFASAKVSTPRSRSFAKKGERKKEASRGGGEERERKRKRRVSRCKLGNCKWRIQRDAITSCRDPLTQLSIYCIQLCRARVSSFAVLQERCELWNGIFSFRGISKFCRPCWLASF